MRDFAINRLFLAVSVSALICFAAAGGEKTPCPAEHLTVPDGTTTSFCNSVAIDGDVFVGGATTGGPSDEGSAHVFRKVSGGWAHEQELHPSDGVQFDRFGLDVAVSGNWIVVAAPQHKHFTPPADGGVYVYRFDGRTWAFVQELYPSVPWGGGLDQDGFGNSIDLRGDRIIVGAPGDDAAYIYRWTGTTWIEEQRLTHAGTFSFGGHVAICEDVALVADPDSSGHSIHAFRFNGSQWVYQQQIQPNPGEPTAGFGDVISLSRAGKSFVAFASSADAISTPAGFPPGLVYHKGPAFVFRDSGAGWVQEQKIDPEPDSHPESGHALAIDGDQAVVGSNYGDQTVSSLGAAFVYQFDGRQWNRIRKLLPESSVPAQPIGFSQSVDVSGPFVVAADWYSAFAYNVDAHPADLDCDGHVGGLDLAGLLAQWGPCPRGGSCGADIDGNGVVNGLDLANLLSAWG